MNNTPDFRVHCILQGEHYPEHFISDFFDSAIAQIQWFQNYTRKREVPLPGLDEAYLQVMDQDLERLRYGKESATVESVPEGSDFSFSIRNERKDFALKNEEGLRMWLRQHLDDVFLHYARIGMGQLCFKAQTPPEVQARLSRHAEVLDEALETAYCLKSPTFWIEGE